MEDVGRPPTFPVGKTGAVFVLKSAGTCAMTRDSEIHSFVMRFRWLHEVAAVSQSIDSEPKVAYRTFHEQARETNKRTGFSMKGRSWSATGMRMQSVLTPLDRFSSSAATGRVNVLPRRLIPS